MHATTTLLIAPTAGRTIAIAWALATTAAVTEAAVTGGRIAGIRSLLVAAAAVVTINRAVRIGNNDVAELIRVGQNLERRQPHRRVPMQAVQHR